MQFIIYILMKKVNEWNIIWFDLYERSEKRDKNQFVKSEYFSE